MSFTVELLGERAFLRSAQQACDELERGCRVAVREGTKAGAHYAKTHHSFTNRTHNLEKSIHAETPVPIRGGAEGAIVAEAKYASHVEEGTKPHTIFGRPFLHFVWKGVPVFFRWVYHPGTKAQPFMGPAYFACEAVMVKEIHASIPRAQAKLDR